MGLDESSLFLVLAEDLKTPLTRIAYKTEQATSDRQAIADIQHITRHTLDLLDAYTLGAHGQTELPLEPVNPSAVMVDTLHDLTDYATRFDCELRMCTPARHASVLIHRPSLQAALSAIAKVFIETQDQAHHKDKFIEIASYATSKGCAVGIFCAGDATLQRQLLSRARANAGSVLRPFAGLASGMSVQLFIAEQLMDRMQTGLRTARRGELSGLAIDLIRSNQLQLI